MIGRTWRIVLATLAVSAILGINVVPAYAAHTDGMLTSISPRGNAAKSGKTKIKAADGTSGTTPVLTYYAKNNATSFNVALANGGRKHVSRNTFAKYVQKGGSSVWFDWKWKKDSKGKRYRYIYKITSSQFAG